MTNEEAAKLVEEAFGMCYNECGSSEEVERYSEACGIAVAALKGQNIKVVAQVIVDTDKLQEICERAAQNIYNELRGEYGKIN